jgi:hypothetical protein
MTLTLLSIHNNLLFFVASVGLIEERYKPQKTPCQVFFVLPSRKSAFYLEKQFKLLN